MVLWLIVVIVAVAVHYILGALTMRALNWLTEYRDTPPFWLVLNGGVVSAIVVIALTVIFICVNALFALAGE